MKPQEAQTPSCYHSWTAPSRQRKICIYLSPVILRIHVETSGEQSGKAKAAAAGWAGVSRVSESQTDKQRRIHSLCIAFHTGEIYKQSADSFQISCTWELSGVASERENCTAKPEPFYKTDTSLCGLIHYHCSVCALISQASVSVTAEDCLRSDSV